MTKIFRLLVLVSAGLYVLWFYFPYVDALLYDEWRVDIWNQSGFDAKFDFPGWHFYLWLVYWPVVWYGLFNFYRWSRDALIIGYILSYFLAPIYGTSIQSPVSGVVGNLSTLLDGIIIGMAYFSPLADRFAGKAPDDSQNQTS